jgi:uncharacterized membrane protein
MDKLIKHFKRIFFTGLGVAVPLTITIYIILKIAGIFRALTQVLFGRSIPLVGEVLVFLAVYLLGLVVTSLIGQYFIRRIDQILSRLPGSRQIYTVWKQVLLTSTDGEGAFSKVIFIPDEDGQRQMLAFTSGKPIPGDEGMICAFVPNSPNPMQGILYVIRKDQVQFSTIPVADLTRLTQRFSVRWNGPRQMASRLG